MTFVKNGIILTMGLYYLVDFVGGLAMESYLLSSVPEKLASLTVEGTHKPGSLTLASGAWISAAGAFVLEKGKYPLNPHDQWVWLAVERGSIVLTWDHHDLELAAGFTCFLPGGLDFFSFCGKILQFIIHHSSFIIHNS